MLCRKPFVKNGAAYPCGQCMPCRWARRKLWAHRIYLESLCHRSNCFLTLTYSDAALIENMITGCSVGPSLKAKHLQDWLKRFRKAIYPLKVRFFACGEYGSKSERPHYHVILFGYPGCLRGMTDRRKLEGGCCAVCDKFRDTWGHGNVFVGTMSFMSAQYVAGYVVKKMTAKDDARLQGREPEFARRSLGIGKDALWEIASQLMAYRLDETLTDVPAMLRHGGKLFPLGRYLRGKLREYIGRDGRLSQEAYDAIQEELRPLREAARLSTDVPSLRGQIVAGAEGRVAQIEARNKIYSKERVL